MQDFDEARNKYNYSPLNFIDLLHPCLPQTLTPENLAEWIIKHAAQQIPHEEQVDLTEENIAELEHKSSMASRKIDELKDVEKFFKETLKKGTPVELPEDPDSDPVPQSVKVTIPPTKGLDSLNANRQWADQQLRDGFTKEITTVYRIPFPEEEMMIGVDIEGREWEQYTRDMDEHEKQAHGMPLVKEASKSKKSKEAEDLFEDH